MSDIKAGDLVMVVGGRNPNALQFIGVMRIVERESHLNPGFWLLDPPTVASNGSAISWYPSHLKKIDPPAEGDSLPTRANLDQPVTA
jgi:hypothetical protein